MDFFAIVGGITPGFPHADPGTFRQIQLQKFRSEKVWKARFQRVLREAMSTRVSPPPPWRAYVITKL